MIVSVPQSMLDLFARHTPSRSPEQQGRRMSQDTGRVLILTVGTGDRTRPGETLLDPFRKTIESGDWERIVLLPSQTSRAQGELVASNRPAGALTIEPLPAAGDEDDVDACYAHFERVLRELIRDGFAPAEIVVDFTRGTKAMSAAVVMAAVRHRVPALRYITGERDERGTVRAGSERLHRGTTAAVSASRQLELAEHFIRNGDAAAALALLPDADDPYSRATWPADALKHAAFGRSIARFCAAWDRLSYADAASGKLPDESSGSAAWDSLLPDAATRRWVEGRAAELDFERELTAEQTKHGSAQLRGLAADLLANGERRIRQEQYEDAVLRAYRVLELVGQFRLLDRGLNAAWLDPQDGRVQKLEKELERKGRGSLSRRRDRRQAAREQGARLLRIEGDKLAERLLQLGDSGPVRADARNKSILIHGFSSAFTDRDGLRRTYRELEQLLIDDDPGGAPKRLELARWMNRLATP